MRASGNVQCGLQHGPRIADVVGVARVAAASRIIGMKAGMLASDSNEHKRQGGFSLLVNAHRGVAELMAECHKCGGTTM